jgi:hypothetical protein
LLEQDLKRQDARRTEAYKRLMSLADRIGHEEQKISHRA